MPYLLELAENYFKTATEGTFNNLMEKIDIWEDRQRPSGDKWKLF